MFVFAHLKSEFIMCIQLVWKPAEVQYATYTSAMWTHIQCIHTENGLLSHPTVNLLKCEIPAVHIYILFLGG